MKRALWLTASWRVRATTYAALVIASVWVLVPFLWALENSIKNLTDTFNPAALIPFISFAPTLTSWGKVIGDPASMNALGSSCIVSFVTTLLVLLLATPAAFSLARFEFPVRSKDINFWFFSQRVMPPVVVLVPFFILLLQLRLVDTWTGLILQFMALFTRHPEKADTPAPADLREAEFETVRGFYADGLVQQVWLRGDAGGACMVVEGASIEEVASKLATLPLVHEGFLQPPMIVPLKPYSRFAPRS